MDKKILQQHLADTLSERTGQTKRKAEAFVRSFFEIMEEALMDDGIVKVKGFGTTKTVSVNNRESVNISTGERFQIEGHDKISFTPDAYFRDLVNRPFAHFSTIVLADDLNEEELKELDEISNEDEEDTTEQTADLTAEEESIIAEYPQAEVSTDETEEIFTEETGNEITGTIATVGAELEIESFTKLEELAEPEPTEPDATQPTESETAEPEATEHLEPKPLEPAPEEIDTPSAILLGQATIEEKENQEKLNNTDDKTENDMQRQIIINNTLPTSRHNWWRSAFIILVTILLMTISYFAGYYRVFCPCDITQTAIANDGAVGICVADTEQVTTQGSSIDKNNKIDSEAAEQAEIAKETEAKKKKEEAEAKEKNAANKYRQLKGGQYLIIGIQEVHTMKKGDNLYKLAQKAYGDKELASYIIFHNNISNPDVVQLEQKIEIPKLKRR